MDVHNKKIYLNGCFLSPVEANTSPKKATDVYSVHSVY